MALALVLEIIAKSGKPLSELIGELPKYSQMKDRASCPNELKESVLNSLRSSVEAPNVATIDGVKLGYKDGSWILIRPSGTEPIFRLYAEAKSPERVAQLIEDYKELVENFIKSIR
jgi:phosphomannomutase/phosphoglucomutase